MREEEEEEDHHLIIRPESQRNKANGTNRVKIPLQKEEEEEDIKLKNGPLSLKKWFISFALFGIGSLTRHTRMLQLKAFFIFCGFLGVFLISSRLLISTKNLSGGYLKI